MSDSRLEPTVESKLVYQGRIVNLRVDTVRLPSGRLTTREIAEHSESVCMVPLDEQGNVLMVRQFRKPAEAELLEVPAGGSGTWRRPSRRRFFESFKKRLGSPPAHYDI